MDMANISEIIDQLSKHETASVKLFLRHKTWLVSKGFVFTNKHLRQIPGLKFKHLLGLFFKRNEITLNTSADAIQVSDNGNRLRAFYVEEGTTLKIVRKESHYGEETLREVKLRDEISKKSNILIPKIESIEEKDGFVFVKELLIKGRSYNKKKDKALFCEQVIDPLKSFYQSMGIEKMPLSKALGVMTVFAHGNKDTMPKELFDLIARNPEVSVSMCHNDVLASNLAVSDGWICFLDWGSALKTICGRDFVRIGRHYLKDKNICNHMDIAIKELQNDALDLKDMLMIQDLWMEFIEFNENGRIYSGVEL